MRRHGAMTIPSPASGLHTRGVPPVRSPLDLAPFITCGARPRHGVEIGKGSLPACGVHRAVIRRQARRGGSAIIRHQVTMGVRDRIGGVPLIGNDVCVGAGREGLGEQTVGRGALAGAVAVVTLSNSRCAVAGAPAPRLLDAFDAHILEMW